MKRILLIVAIALGATTSQALGAFEGAKLQNPRAGVGVTFNGTAYPRVFCFGGTEGFCTGTITIRRGRSVLGSAPLAVRSGDGPSAEVPLRGSRSAILRGGRSITVTIRTHDNQGVYKTFKQSSFLKSG